MRHSRFVERVAMWSLIVVASACADSGADLTLTTQVAASTTAHAVLTTATISTTAAPTTTSATTSTSPTVTDPITTSTIVTSQAPSNPGTTQPASPWEPSSGQPVMMDSPTVLAASSHAAVVGFLPAESPGRAVDRYEVAANPGSTTECSSSPCTIDGLTLGSTYQFRVRAHNVRGWGEWSPWSSSHTADQVPDAPPPPVATGGDGEAIVSWGVLPNSGTAVISVTVRVSDGQSFVFAANAGGTAVISGLVNGSAYSFTIAATNAAGDSEVSPPSSVVVPAGLPWALSDLLVMPATAGDSVALAWPSVNGNGAPVLFYEVLWDGGVVTTTLSLSTTLSFAEALAPGSLHTVQIRAINMVGAGPWTARTIQIPL